MEKFVHIVGNENSSEALFVNLTTVSTFANNTLHSACKQQKNYQKKS